jgi:predicted  nucleic acid-binding Zn-ribbon protein
MENQTNSISHNLNKLRKYQQRLAGTADPAKNSIYEQKIQFYQQNLQGAGVNNSTLANTGTPQNAAVDSLISKIDSLIQKSKSTRARVSGGHQLGGRSLNAVSGHRIMTIGARSQAGGAALTPEHERLVDEAEKLNVTAPPMRADTMTNQKRIADEVIDRIGNMETISKDKSATITSLRNEVLRLTAQMGRTGEGKDIVIKEKDDLTTDLAGLHEKIAFLEAQNVALKGENDGLVRAKEELEAEIEKLKALVADLEAKLAARDEEGTTSGDEIAELRETIEKLKAELAEVKEQLANRDDVVIPDLEKQIEDLKAQADGLVAEIKEKDDKIADLEAQMGTEDVELKRVMDALEKAMGKKDELQEENQTLTDALGELQNKVDAADLAMKSSLTDVVKAEMAFADDSARHGNIIPGTNDAYNNALAVDAREAADRKSRERAKAPAFEDDEEFGVGFDNIGEVTGDVGEEVEEVTGDAGEDAGLGGGSYLDELLQYSVPMPQGF